MTLAERPPRILQDGKRAAKELLNLDTNAIQLGHGVWHTDPLPNVLWASYAVDAAVTRSAHRCGHTSWD
eukprot:3696462-Pyramimonas_sp.AAC.1